MKYLLICLLLSIGQASAQTSVYDLSIQELNGSTIKMASFKGKKILVVSVSPNILLTEKLRFLDSVQLANINLVVIAVPSTDYDTEKSVGLLSQVKDDPARKIIITIPGLVKKDNGANQARILKWLTSDTENIHFNGDVDTEEQLYFISESGILYAVLSKNAAPEIINGLLKQADVK